MPFFTKILVSKGFMTVFVCVYLLKGKVVNYLHYVWWWWSKGQSNGPSMCLTPHRANESVDLGQLRAECRPE